MKTRSLWPALGLLMAANSAQAATFVVTRSDDPDPGNCSRSSCSLREAVNAANRTAGSHRIELGATTYTLTRIDSNPSTPKADRGALWVRGSVEFVGAGSRSTLVRWNNPLAHANALIRVEADGANPVTLGLRALSLSQGRGTQGGCIRMVQTGATHHQLQLDGVHMSKCLADFGGAAYLAKTDLVLVNSVLEQNSARYDGGALYFMGPNLVDSFQSRIADNLAQRNGGAVALVGNGITGWQTNVIWRDDGASAIRGNRADNVGGAFAVIGTSTLNLATADDAVGNAMLQISGNQARSGGGLHLASGLTQVNLGNTLARLRILDNRAEEGGAITSQVALTLRDSELAGNQATAGNGGAIAFQGTTEWQAGRVIERSSLHRNSAVGGGAAIHSECAGFSANDVSMHLNQAAQGRGQAIETIGSATLRHVSLYANNSLPILGSPALYKTYSTACHGKQVRYANSLIGDYCSAVNGGLVSDGGNQLGVNASACPALSRVDQRQSFADAFQVGFHDYGGPFEVIGWSPAAPSLPQRDFGLASYCSQLDVRGFPRDDGFCDAGAFEQQNLD